MAIIFVLLHAKSKAYFIISKCVNYFLSLEAMTNKVPEKGTCP